jgi:predicted RNase H-like nuclease (RuvC/YqgF family)
VNLIDNHRMCNTFTLRNEEGLSFVEESQDRMKLRTVEMAKLDINKPLEDMNEQEKMIYYFLNCHKGMDDSKIKVMIESDGVIQMLEKRVETISDDGWKKIIEDFQKLHENEERMELQLELEEAQKEVKELNQERVLMVQMMLKNGMSVSQIAKSVSKSEEEIMKWIS